MIRVLFYVQHLLGIGHLRRAALLSQALSAKGMQVIVAYGGMPDTGIDFGCKTEVVQLPPIRAADVTFTRLVTAHGKAVDATWQAQRLSLLLSLFDRVAPHILLIETYPFGRRRFRFELSPLLDVAHRRKPRPLIVCSVRDILVSHRNHHVQTAEIVEQVFDLVLVHGDARLVEFSVTFPLVERIAAKLYYTGYVTSACGVRPQDDSKSQEGANEIIVSTGGGAVGFPLLKCAVEAGRSSHRRWRILLGPNLLRSEVERLLELAGTNVVVEANRPDFVSLLTRCAVSISQAGYNTMMDIIRARCRAIVIPFATDTETEQELRARLFAARGIVQIISADDLSAPRLSAAVTKVLCTPLPPLVDISMHGAQNTAERLLKAVRC